MLPGEPKRTWLGRVVYNRKPHGFRWSDAVRIVSRLELPDAADLVLSRAERADFAAALRVWAEINRKIAFFLGGSALDVLSALGMPRGFSEFATALEATGIIWQKLYNLR